jgi:hypothetical protein
LPLGIRFWRKSYRAPATPCDHAVMVRDLVEQHPTASFAIECPGDGSAWHRIEATFDLTRLDPDRPTTEEHPHGD